MKDAYEILRLKEIDLSKVEGEVEALRIVAPSCPRMGTSPLRMRRPRSVGLRPRGPARFHRQ
jgi:hypothetical protein